MFTLRIGGFRHQGSTSKDRDLKEIKAVTVYLNPAGNDAAMFLGLSQG